jgi:hypothetical protein
MGTKKSVWLALACAGAMASGAMAQPANDSCSGAIDLSAGPFPLVTDPVSIMLASQPAEFPTAPTSSYTIWYKLVPTVSGSATFQTCTGVAPSCTVGDTVIAVYSSDGTCGGLTQIASNDDACGLRTIVSAAMTAGQTYYIQMGKYGTGAPASGADSLSMYVTAPTPPPADRWVEQGDAGDLPSSAQIITGSGPMGSISGAITGDADMFEVTICDPANFSASTVGTTTWDTQLWIFLRDGHGVVMNDDTTAGGVLQSRISPGWITAAGTYYLAITQWDKDALDDGGNQLWLDTVGGVYTVEHAPDDLGAANAIAFWSSGGAGSGTYIINLTGACFGAASTCGSADFDHDGDSATDADIEAFFRCIAGNCCALCDSADFNGDGDSATDADIEAFFRVLAGGTC